ncbi:hypothetical protein [Candidatus Magnetomonas plexicatena]|uniref:hypothetical protein n=1 Tax=Candidatus Magnetomonas plexicatena TaxID=2552947 RepID=UPI00110421F9|nr:hypothetical protein E2O03_014980 [Nitrospirales bacterium LBB_01]
MKTIVWDNDDVLNDLMYQWFNQKWLPENHNCLLCYEELTENPPHRILGVTLREYLQSLDEFRLSQKYQAMEPVGEVMEWFKRHGEGFRHIALTATSFASAHVSASWVIKHYGKWIRTFHFIPAMRADERHPVYDTDKAAFLKWLDKADALVDDSKTNIADCIGVNGILFPRPWNGLTTTINQALGALLL